MFCFNFEETEDMTNHLTKDLLLETLARELARRVGCRGLAKTISVYWNRRLKTTAGLACFERKAILLNPRLLEVDTKEVQKTLRHELAHFIAQYRVGRKKIAPHGVEWRAACRDLGIPNESCCHNLPFKPRRLLRRHFYECPACGTVMARVKPVKKEVACLRCCRKHNNGRYHDRFRFIAISDHQRIAA